MDIIALLEAKGIEYVPKLNNEISIVCPFQAKHSDGIDSLPSFNINLIKEKAFCFACGSSMSQVALATWLLGEGLDEFTKQSMLLKGKLKQIQTETCLGADTSSMFLLPPGAPWDTDFRGIQQETLQSLKAINCQTGWYSNRICFPISQKGELLGTDARALGSDMKPKYLRPKGCDAKKWLYPFDLAKEAQVTRVILCEGIFHAINYYDKMGLPEALSYFGSNNWSEHKLLLLLELGINEVIFFPDNDKAGLSARDKVCPMVSQWLPTYHIPTQFIPEGKDLGDLSREEIETAITNKEKWK